MRMDVRPSCFAPGSKTIALTTRGALPVDILRRYAVRYREPEWLAAGKMINADCRLLLAQVVGSNGSYVVVRRNLNQRG